jgi:hypothetical protein
MSKAILADVTVYTHLGKAILADVTLYMGNSLLDCWVVNDV